MTQDEILEMVREAGGSDVGGPGWTTWVGTQSTEFLERFARLVAAKNKERILQLIKELRPAIMPLENMGRGKDTQAWFDILVEGIREMKK